MELHTYRIDKSKSPFAPIFEFTLCITDVTKEIKIEIHSVGLIKDDLA